MVKEKSLLSSGIFVVKLVVNADIFPWKSGNLDLSVAQEEKRVIGIHPLRTRDICMKHGSWRD